MNQNKGNFVVMRSTGRVVEDKTDYEALYRAFADDPKNRNKPFDAWMAGDKDDVEFVGCLWELEDGSLKACVTDRKHNMVEIAGVSIEVAASVLRQALQLAD